MSCDALSNHSALFASRIAYRVPGALLSVMASRRYDFFLASPLLGGTQYETEFDFGGTHVYVSTCVVEGLRCFFIEPQNGFFAVDSVYGRRDDGMRFEFFCRVRCRAWAPKGP